MTLTNSRTIRRHWIHRSAIGLAAAALLGTGGAADDPADAKEVVRETIDQVLEVLAREDLSAEQRRQEIEQIAYERFDFTTISERVLRGYWKRFSPEQREEFIEQFKIQLSRSYGSRIERYEQEKVKILRRRVDKGGDVWVVTRIEGGQAKGNRVDYRLRKKEGSWKVIDVIIEGVSLENSNHAQFRDILRRGGPEDVLKQLREKNAASPA